MENIVHGRIRTTCKEMISYVFLDSAIMFRNKIQTTPFIVGEDVTFTCTVISPNSPAIVTWYRDEQLLGEDTYRTEPQYSAETGEASLTIRNPKDYDAAIYKCVARNKDGRVSCEARLLLGGKGKYIELA